MQDILMPEIPSNDLYKRPRVYPPSIRSGEFFIGFSIMFKYLKLYPIITLQASSLEPTMIEVKV